MFQTLFLTSSPCAWPPPPGVHAPFLLREEEGFLRELSQRIGPHPNPHLLLIASTPDAHAQNDAFVADYRDAFRASGWPALTADILDSRNTRSMDALLGEADIILLCGGHVPTQNRFFQAIGLRESLRQFQGIIIGISAGSMNAAQTVYAQPEEPGESIDPAYQRFLPGLGLTDLHILPHYNENRDTVLDGRRLYAEITLPDSDGMPLLAIPDGSYVLSEEDHEVLHGEGYLLLNGKMTQISGPGDQIALTQAFFMDYLVEKQS